jgi:hypothetical protein
MATYPMTGIGVFTQHALAAGRWDGMKLVLAFALLLGCAETTPLGPAPIPLPTPPERAHSVVSHEKQDPPRATIRLPDAEYTLLEAHDLGSLHESMGRFIQLRYSVINLGRAPAPLLDPPRIVDALDRQFSRSDVESRHLPAGAAVVRIEDGMEEMMPNVRREYWTVIEVPADATELRFLVMTFAFGGPTKSVALGL